VEDICSTSCLVGSGDNGQRQLTRTQLRGRPGPARRAICLDGQRGFVRPLSPYEHQFSCRMVACIKGIEMTHITRALARALSKKHVHWFLAFFTIYVPGTDLCPTPTCTYHFTSKFSSPMPVYTVPDTQIFTDTTAHVPVKALRELPGSAE
jgi:hypothetical protein